MLYFIPAWYKNRNWCENEQTWYARRMHSEFDDTVKHVQLFHRSGAYPSMILLLSFAPNFRHFLHRQSVYHAKYWSCFDAIQEIERNYVRMFSFHSLKWPEGVEFIYTPFAIVAMLRGEKYAQIEFGEDGNLIEILMFQKEKLYRKNIYDDRGFVSATILYKEDKPLYQDYLNEQGVWKMRYFYQDGHVEINPALPHYRIVYEENVYAVPFKKCSYESLEQVIYEVFAKYLSYTDAHAVFCAAMHDLHADLLKEALRGKKMILSFFEDRYETGIHKEHMDMICSADYIITDSRENTDKIQANIGTKLQNITDITPFDSRVDFGISQQLNVQKILVPVDGLGDQRFNELIAALGNYLLENDNAQVHLFTRYADYDRMQIILARTREVLRNAGLQEEWATEESIQGVAENGIDETDSIPVRFFAERCVDELSVSKCMREQRLIVDMRTKTEVYLRIAGISVGIPQIVYTPTQFVKHCKNGFVIQDMGQIHDALDYYLSSFNNWNEAMVYSYELGKRYTTSVLIDEWREVISFVEQNSDTAVRRL